MEEYNLVTLENGVDYIEIDEVTYNDTKYVLLVNHQNIKDSCVRKVLINEGQEYLYKVKDELEYSKVLNLFVQKNKDLF